MKKEKIAKCIGAGLVLCMGAGLVTGCKNKTVDYRLEGETESESSQENDSGGKKGVGQFAGALAWQEEWTAVNTKGNEVEVSIDAKISLPEAERMYVVEVEKPEFDAAYKEKIAKQIFGDGELYYNDLAHLPKKELEEERSDLLEMMDTMEDVESAEELEKEIMGYDELLETAKDTYTPIAAYDVDEYLGERDGGFYELSFRDHLKIGRDETEYETRNVSLSPKDIDQVCPEELKGKECWYYPEFNTHYYVENQCGLSEEAALELAQHFVEGLEMGYSVYTYSVPLVWGCYNTESESEAIDVNEVANGYVFYYDAGIEQISFTGFGAQNHYENYGKKREDEQDQYSLGATLKVYVTDKGVIGMGAESPIEITGISGETELLPLNEVEGIMKEQITEHFGTFRFSYTADDRRVECNEMELIYFRVRDRENPGHYSYVPAWRLSNIYRDESNPYIAVIKNQVLVNAIDGSVIDFYDEV